MMQVQDQFIIGENRTYGYHFAVGRIGPYWIGYAMGAGMLFVFTEISRGHELGIEDRDLAIRMTCALGNDPEHSYGGIEEYFVPPELQARPEEFCCEHCGRNFCNGECRHDVYPSVWADEEIEDPRDEPL